MFCSADPEFAPHLLCVEANSIVTSSLTMAQGNSIDYFAIRNTVARYCLVLDTQDWPGLAEVFTPDLEARYPFRDEMIIGVPALSEAIQGRLRHITSQHALTTQTIDIAADGETATAITYFTGIHFGKGRWAGKDVTAWGKYVDTLVVLRGQPSLPGSSGKWLIKKREVHFQGRRGEEGVLTGEEGP